VIKLLLTAFALGVASLDVARALVAVGAMGAGARLRALLAFGCFCILGTVAFGTVLSLVVGPRIEGIDWGVLLPHDPTEDRVAELDVPPARCSVVVPNGWVLHTGVRVLVQRKRRPGASPRIW
jgi:hypothetical protein